MGARENDLNPDTWIGLSFPLGRTNKGLFRRTKTTLEQAKFNIQNLLLTVKGERPFQPEFGSNIYRFIFEPLEEEQLTTGIEEEIRTSLTTWLPYVLLENIVVDFSDRDRGKVTVNLSFSISLNPDNIEQIALTYESGEF